MADSVERRRCARAEVVAQIGFRRPREAFYAIRAHDLSPEGCRLASPERLDAGDLVWVQMPTLESLPAWVRWTRDAQAGVEFDRAMHPAVFGMMAKRLAPASA